jgi:hypothetical protein
MVTPYAYDAPNSIRALPRDNLFDGDVDFGTCIIESQCELTDLVSSAPLPPWGLFVSSKLKSLLQSFTLPIHRFYRLHVLHRDLDTQDYYWLHLPQPDLVIPDDSTITAAEGLIRGHEHLGVCDLVLLSIPSRFAYTYVSSPLVARMTADGISGVRFGTPRLFRTGG